MISTSLSGSFSLFEVKHINVGKFIEQDALAFHHGLGS